MRTLKNICYGIREITKISKSIIPVMVIVAAVTALEYIVDLFLIKYVIDYALSDSFSISTVLIYLFLYFLFLILCKIFGTLIVNGYIEWFEVRFKSHTVSRLYKKISEFDMIHYNDVKFYDKMSRAVKEGGSRYFILLTQLFTLLTSALTLSSVLAVYHDGFLLAAVSVNVLVYMIYYHRANKRKYEFDKKEEIFDRFENYLNRIFSQRDYAQELRTSSGAAELLIDKLSDASGVYAGSYASYLKKYMHSSVLMTTLSYLIYWISALYISGQFFHTRITAGDFLVLANVVSAMTIQLVNALKALPDIYQSGLYIDDIREIMDASFLSDRDTGERIETFEKIEFQNVCFRYDSLTSFALHDLSFSIEKNEVVAIVGTNGSGKTTILDCLLNLLKPESGRVEINGRAYDAYRVDELRKLFSVVFQDFRIYEISIAENILMHRVESEDDAAIVDDALRYVGLYDKVNAMEKGRDTVIFNDGEGVELSVGERQKIAIARAYARKSPVLIFDEPTSALDVYAEEAFYAKLLEMREQEDRTIVFTTHKLHHMMRADKILYVENGKVTETGSHEELMGLGGGYAALYQAQSDAMWEEGV